MGVVKTILLVAFVIVCVLAVLLVLVQNDEGNGMGSAFGGQSTAFGARSGSVLKKTTGVLVFLFFAITIVIGVLNKAPAKEDLSKAVEAVQGTVVEERADSGNWLEEEVNGSAESVQAEVSAQ